MGGWPHEPFKEERERVMREMVLYIDDLRSSYSSNICRICHEEEFESCKSLETPCGCSGSVKFAHRDCVQRWCDEKGNTICEICLQISWLSCIIYIIVYININAIVVLFIECDRGSLEVPRNEQGENEIVETEHQCEDADHRSPSFCTTLALIFTALLLTRHLFAIITGAGDYPFSLLTVLIARASGILVPMYILIRILSALQSNIRHHYQRSDVDFLSPELELYGSKLRHMTRMGYCVNLQGRLYRKGLYYCCRSKLALDCRLVNKFMFLLSARVW
ncbi:hypothetical protein SASPL_119964 [Salvia splendens]|uniref:RING-CH-type domain-containing protein n=1 Tax=Salvia splendens TaxID=180675 RepID=A0A8X8XP99_SALSN|nr:hypothetical protein SASPL_119964 [Salvia splendens]